MTEINTQTDEMSLHIGLRFADGKSVANVRTVPERATSTPSGLFLTPLAFGGSPYYRNRSYWARPLPPAGPLTFICQWLAFGIPAKRVEIDAQSILDAARHSIEIWPKDNE
jgi:hypothetical protein